MALSDARSLLHLWHRTDGSPGAQPEAPGCKNCRAPLFFSATVGPQPAPPPTGGQDISSHGDGTAARAPPRGRTETRARCSRRGPCLRSFPLPSNDLLQVLKFIKHRKLAFNFFSFQLRECFISGHCVCRFCVNAALNLIQ